MCNYMEESQKCYWKKPLHLHEVQGKTKIDFCHTDDRNQKSSCCWEEELEAKNGHKRTSYHHENALYFE